MNKTAANTALALPVMEHFYTLQGEGAWSGTAAYFIRLSGCDVGCVWCDVKESWEVKPGQDVNIDDLVTAVVSSGCGRAVITGGEPAMYDLGFLTNEMKRSGIQVHLETSGVYPILGEFDWICLSPKKFRPALPDSYRVANELKVIVYNEHDLNWAEKEADKCDPEKTNFFLQAEWGRRDENYPLITEYIRAHPRWRMSLQSHKYAGIP